MGSSITKNSSTTFANQANPTQNYYAYSFWNLLTASGNTRYGYIHFLRQAPLGATIVSAKLRFRNVDSIAASTTMTLRLINASWSRKSLTWNNKPAASAVTHTLTKATATPATMWEFDVTAQMQAVSNGGAWWGWRVDITTAVSRRFGQLAASVTLQPELEVVWSDAPEAPDEIYPSGGRAVAVAKPVLRANFVDFSGDITMSAMQVQINPTDLFTAPAFDSGEVANTTGVLDLATTAYAGLANGATAYWRVRVKDAGGLWSDWSRSESFVRANPGTVAITSPSGGFVEDSTPVIAWTFSGTQRAYQVLLTLQGDPSSIVWTSGKLSGTDNSLNIPPSKLLQLGVLYTVYVRVWDDFDRESNAAVPAYVEDSENFAYQLVGSVTAVTSLAVAASPGGPWVELTFNRTTFPDTFTVYRDGEVVESNIDPADIFVSGTSFKYIDRSAAPRRDHEWMVVPIVNGSAPATNLVQTTHFRSNPNWIAQLDGSNAVPFFNPSRSLAQSQEGAVKQVLDSEQNLVISKSRGGYQGSVTGRVMGYGGLTSEEIIDRLEAIRLSTNPLVYFTFANECILGAIDKITYNPVPKTEEVLYDISFDIYQRRSIT